VPRIEGTTIPENREKRPNWRTGAPDGNKNALKHGRYAAKTRALRRRVRELRLKTEKLLARLESERLRRENDSSCTRPLELDVD